jgi:hypothetical protein
VIVTSGPVGDGLADALGFALAEPAEAVLPLPAGLTMVVVLVVQADSAATKTAAETVLVRLMSPPFPGRYGMYATPSLSLYGFRTDKTAQLRQLLDSTHPKVNRWCACDRVLTTDGA